MGKSEMLMRYLKIQRKSEILIMGVMMMVVIQALVVVVSQAGGGDIFQMFFGGGGGMGGFGGGQEFNMGEAAVVRQQGSETAFEDPARVINIGSVDGIKVPAQGTYPYSASKAGVHHMTRHFAGHHGSKGITFNAIAP